MTPREITRARAAGTRRGPGTATAVGCKPERIQEDRAALKANIQDDFWVDLRKQRLVAPNAPLPIDR